MTRTIYRPAAVTLTAIDKKVAFVPYKESFTYTIEEGDSVQFEVERAEEVLYYLMQEDGHLAVEEILSDNPSIDFSGYVTVTFTNNNEKDAHFVPYNQNFAFTVKPGDSLVISSKENIANDYYAKLAYGDFTVEVGEKETAEFSIITSDCSVNLYHKENGTYVKVTDGEEEGTVVVGDNYKAVAVLGAGKTLSIFRCNGVDIAKATTVEGATELTATEEGFSIVAVATGDDSSSSYIG